MKLFATLVLVALVAPFVAADPNVQTGTGVGAVWTPVGTVDVQGGTSFLLAGAAGDMDIEFYDANGNWLGWSIQCGADSGITPQNAVRGVILQWDAIGTVAPCVLTVGGPSQWFYVDGL
ncbi:MAG TPA: hypothetical protein VFH78_09950 [Candidatus Thermoplasmatota archaeon]|nr:hypothetical protein [Candidatus Thermoplasmatota archaeon]